MTIKCSTCREPVRVCGCHDDLDDESDGSAAERIEEVAEFLENHAAIERRSGQSPAAQAMVDAAADLRDVIADLE